MSSPTDIANLYAWYKSDAGLFDATSGGNPVTADGAAIKRWEDQSGNGRHLTQGTTGDCLLYDAIKGLVVDPYDGTNRFMNTPVSFTLDRRNYTVLVIGENSTCVLSPFAGTFRWFTTTNLSGFGEFDLGQYALGDGGAAGPYLGAYDLSATHGSPAIQLTNKPSLFGWIGNSTKTLGVIDGSIFTGAASAMTAGSRTITALLGKSNDSWQGSYKDVIIYSSALSLSDITNIIFPYAISRGVSSSKLGQIVFYGDSITAGYGSSLNRSYPSRITLSDTIRRRNISLAGSAISNLDTNYSSNVTPVLVSGETNVIIVFSGTNDINGGATGATVYANLDSIRTKVQATGAKCVTVTMLPRSTLSVAQETQRLAYNTLIHTNSANFDATVFLDNDSRMEAQFISTYSSDGTHPNDAGYAIIATLIQNQISQFFPSSVTSSPVVSFAISGNRVQNGRLIVTVPGTSHFISNNSNVIDQGYNDCSNLNNRFDDEHYYGAG